VGRSVLTLPNGSSAQLKNQQREIPCKRVSVTESKSGLKTENKAYYSDEIDKLAES
jgi:hypothetical protein